MIYNGNTEADDIYKVDGEALKTAYYWTKICPKSLLFATFSVESKQTHCSIVPVSLLISFGLILLNLDLE